MPTTSSKRRSIKTGERLASAALVFLLLLAVVPQARAAVTLQDSARIDGVMRHWYLYLPDGLQPNAPLVVATHGYGGRATGRCWMNEAADRHKFAVCMPQGLKAPRGKTGWNVGYPVQEGWKQDDERALCRIARIVQKRHQLSRRNTFFTGMSNGGEMCYLLALSRQTTFKAFASVAGLTLEWMMEKRQAARPVPFMEIHGTEDRTSEWTGDHQNQGGWGAYMPVPMAVNYWVALAGATYCETTQHASLDPTSTHSVIKHKYRGGRQGIEVWLYEVVGGKHSTHTADLHTGEEIWAFFSKYLE